MHPPINREETVVRVFIRNVWKVAFELMLSPPL